MSNRSLAVFAGVFALLTLGASIVVPFLVLNTASDKLPNLQPPLLALSGFIGVFACVALLVLAFKAMDLADGSQALGMPEGSIRALIAIFLIVTLGMAALFLLSPSQHQQAANPGGGPTNNGSSQSDSQSKNDSKKPSPAAKNSVAGSNVQLAALQEAPVQPGVTAPSPTQETTSNEKKAPEAPQDKDQNLNSGNATATETEQGESDLAKQFLTLVGGLVTTVVGFYFGSQTANSATAKGANAARTAATEAINAMSMKQ